MPDDNPSPYSGYEQIYESAQSLSKDDFTDTEQAEEDKNTSRNPVDEQMEISSIALYLRHFLGDGSPEFSAGMDSLVESLERLFIGGPGGEGDDEPDTG